MPSAVRVTGALVRVPAARHVPNEKYGVQRPSGRRTRTSIRTALAAGPVTFQLGINSLNGATVTTGPSSRSPLTGGRGAQLDGTVVCACAARSTGTGDPKLVCWA
ncbi:hypothetical protein GCM10010842_29170 [Deinococcus daejeonensis]|uniref:Uncharacterized protein n=1 Tax=Deinococcus daejeonensis TaxID=1007098 RepID=A0ABQ2JCN2_9DEIO|nr:hypothetical protein GCM10010842_29170 [Deinococcus daejeonensis]